MIDRAAFKGSVQLAGNADPWKGLTTKLLVAAVEYARKRGATAVEGYPQDPKDTTVVEAFAWTGFASAFKKAGFKEVARRSPTRPVMRILC